MLGRGVTLICPSASSAYIVETKSWQHQCQMHFQSVALPIQPIIALHELQPHKSSKILD